MAIQTTFSMFQQILSDAVDAYSNLDTTFKSALKTRISALPKLERVSLTAENVESSTDATVSEANNSITVVSGSSGTIQWEMANFSTPVRIDGTLGEIGALVGHVGGGSNTPIANSDINLYYRESSSGTYKAFGRNTVLNEVTSIQFQVITGTLGVDGDLPQLHILAEQL